MSLKQKACAQFTSVFPYENILKPFGHLATFFQFPPCMIGDGHFVSTPSMSLGWHYVKNTKIPMTFLKFVASYFVVSFLKGMYLLYLPIIIYINYRTKKFPLQRDYFNRKYIWTNHQFSGDILVLGSVILQTFCVFLASHQTWDFSTGSMPATWSSFHESEADKHRLAVAARSFQVTRGLGAGWALGGLMVFKRSIRRGYQLQEHPPEKVNFQLAKVSLLEY